MLVYLDELSTQMLMLQATMQTTPRVKKQDTKLLAITSLTIIRFSKFFSNRLGSKFATNSCLYIPPRFKHIATLPCEI